MKLQINMKGVSDMEFKVMVSILKDLRELLYDDVDDNKVDYKWFNIEANSPQQALEIAKEKVKEEKHWWHISTNVKEGERTYKSYDIWNDKLWDLAYELK
jgi:hypothetical protein